MKIKKFAVKSLKAFIGLCIVLIILAYTAPLLLDKTTLRSQASQRLSQWLGGTILVHGPIKISYFPDVTVSAQHVHLERIKQLDIVSNFTTKKLTARLNWWSLFFGEIEIKELTLEQPKIVMAGAADKEQGEQPQTLKLIPILQFFQRSSVGKIEVQDGEISRVFDTAHIEQNKTPENAQNNILISSINGTLTTPQPKQSFSAQGRLHWRGEPLSFTFSATSPEKIAAPINMPLTFTLQSKLVRSRFSGKLTASKTIQLSGEHALNISDLAKFTQWTGYDFNLSAKRKTLSATGAFNWGNNKISFDKARFTFDKNQAMGTMNVDLSEKTALIDGTLAFDTLDISPYLSSANNNKAATDLSDVNANPFTILRSINADLRLSFSRIIAGAIESKRAALAISLRNGKMLTDFADLEIFEGTATGNVAINTQNDAPHFIINARLKGVQTHELLASLTLPSPVTGKANLTFDLNGEGANLLSLKNTLNGNIQYELIGKGQTNLDFKKTASETALKKLRSWSSIFATNADIDKLKLTLAFKNGRGHCDNLALSSGPQHILGNGEINLGKQDLKWRLAHSAAQQKPSSPSEASPPPPSHDYVKLEGPWAKPNIIFEPGVQKNTITPTSNTPERIQNDQSAPQNAPDTQPDTPQPATPPGNDLPKNFPPATPPAQLTPSQGRQLGNAT